MNSLEDFESEYKDASAQLYTAAVEAARAKKTMIEQWVALHYPAIPCVVTVVNDNLLSLDVCFPGIDRATSTRLAYEVNDYLQELIEIKST